MADNEQALKDMDEAAKKAAAELKLVTTLADVQTWWRRHYATAGHKRLGRILLEHKGD